MKLWRQSVWGADMARTPFQIELWLKELFDFKPFPQYEVNDRTTKILCHLADWNEAADRDLGMAAEDLKLKATEIKAEAAHLQNVLADIIGQPYASLSRMGNNYLNQLVESCLVLELKDSSLGSFIPAINELSNELVKIEAKNKEKERDLTNLKKKLTDALVMEKSLQQDLQKAEEQCTLEKAKVEVRIQNMKKLKDKSEEYKYKIVTAQDCLMTAGMDDTLTHRSLVTLSETLAEVTEQSKALKEKLKSYQDLAPNPSLVKVKIEEAKRELKATEAELTTKVNMMEFVLPDPGKRRLN